MLFLSAIYSSSKTIQFWLRPLLKLLSSHHTQKLPQLQHVPSVREKSVRNVLAWHLFHRVFSYNRKFYIKSQKKNYYNYNYKKWQDSQPNVWGLQLLRQICSKHFKKMNRMNPTFLFSNILWKFLKKSISLYFINVLPNMFWIFINFKSNRFIIDSWLILNR